MSGDRNRKGAATSGGRVTRRFGSSHWGRRSTSGRGGGGGDGGDGFGAPAVGHLDDCTSELNACSRSLDYMFALPMRAPSGVDTEENAPAGKGGGRALEKER